MSKDKKKKEIRDSIVQCVIFFKYRYMKERVPADTSSYGCDTVINDCP